MDGIITFNAVYSLVIVCHNQTIDLAQYLLCPMFCKLRL